MDQVSTVYYQLMIYWSPTYCNDTDIILNTYMMQPNRIIDEINTDYSRIKPLFKLDGDIEVRLMISHKH